MVCCHAFSFIWEFWKNVCPEQWKESSGPTAGLDPASVFSPLDVYLWEHPKSTVCATAGTRRPGLNNKYRNDLRCFELHLEFSNKLGSHPFRRTGSCVEAQGGHFWTASLTGGPKQETMLQKTYFCKLLFLVLWCTLYCGVYCIVVYIVLWCILYFGVHCIVVYMNCGVYSSSVSLALHFSFALYLYVSYWQLFNMAANEIK
jgi:hypothetical protein